MNIVPYSQIHKDSPIYLEIVNEINNFPEEYLPSLISILKIFKDSLTIKSPEESLKQALIELSEWKTQSIENLWDGIDAQ